MNIKPIHIAAVLAVIFLLVNSIFVVDQRQSGLVLQFGEYVRTINEPGLKMKIPFIQNVMLFEKRVQNLNADTTEVISSDQKTMRVDAFTKYKIIDAFKFFQTANDERNFKQRLSPILDSSLRQVLGSYPFKALLTPDRAMLMKKIKDIVNNEAKSFGVEIIDVRIMRADLPELSRQAVYDRMKSERAKEAQELRSEGAEAAQKITATADKEKLVILSEARKTAEVTKGEGDSEAIKTFASTFGKDPEFYDFYRSMQAYKVAITNDNSKFVISSENEFFKYVKKN